MDIQWMVRWWVLVGCGRYDIHTHICVIGISFSIIYQYSTCIDPMLLRLFVKNHSKTLKKPNGFHEITDKELAVLWLVMGFFQNN